MKKIAIIPARGGSKRIPRKNIRDFLGKPIIAYSIEAAIKSNLFDEVMVSTDDLEIAAIAKEYGASVPFLRGTATSNDFAPLADVISEVLQEYKVRGMEFDVFCCLLATAPFVSSNKLLEAYSILESGIFETVIPVLRFSYPIQRALKKEGDLLKLANPKYKNARSQDLDSRFHDCGQFYWMRTIPFFEQKTLFSKKCASIELQEYEVQDIDSEEDWRMAEIKYRILMNE